MFHRRARIDLVLALSGVLIVAVVALVLTRGTTAPSATMAPSPTATLDGFSRTYLEYLDGSVPARAIPDADNSVRRLVTAGGQLPAGARDGALALTGLRLRYIVGATTGAALVIGRDRRHTVPFNVSFSYAGGRWTVVDLLPPDLATIVGVHHAPTPPTPSALTRAARAFTLAYVAYREGSGPRPSGGAPLVLRQLATSQDPLAGIHRTHARGQIVAVTLGPAVDGAAAASAVAASAGRRLSFSFDLQLTGGRWQVSGFPVSG